MVTLPGSPVEMVNLEASVPSPLSCRGGREWEHQYLYPYVHYLSLPPLSLLRRELEFTLGTSLGLSIPFFQLSLPGLTRERKGGRGLLPTSVMPYGHGNRCCATLPPPSYLAALE